MCEFVVSLLQAKFGRVTFVFFEFSKLLFLHKCINIQKAIIARYVSLATFWVLSFCPSLKLTPHGISEVEVNVLGINQSKDLQL